MRRPGARDFWTSIALSVLGAVGLGFLVWLLLDARQAERTAIDAAARLEAQDLARRQQDASAPGALPTFEPDAMRIAAMAQADLGAMLRAIESSPLDGVRLQRLDLDAAGSRGNVTVEAESHEAALKYLAALRSAWPDGEWQITELSRVPQTARVTATIVGSLHRGP